MIPLAACLTTLCAAATLFPAVAFADVIRLNDGTVVEGELGAPAEVAIQTASGPKRVAFALLPTEVQRQYWQKGAENGEAAEAGPVTSDDLTTLANEVSLASWQQVTASATFRDPAKGANAIEQSWVNVYSPKDPVGESGNWNTQLARARALQARSGQFSQKHWLEVFIRTGEALDRRDAKEFAALVGELEHAPLAVALAAGKYP